MKKMLLALAIFLVLSFNSFSQDRVIGYTNFSSALPMGEYKQINNSNIWGGRAGVLIKPYKKVPLKLGVELGYMTQGFATQYYNSINFSQFSDFRVRARVNIITGLFNMRLQTVSKKHRFAPFLEGLIGFNNFYGTTKLQGRNPAQDYSWGTVDRDNTNGYWSLTYGGSTGFDISFDKYKIVWLECRVAYLYGSNTKYYTNPAVDTNGYGKFTLAESKTDMLIPQIGLKFGF